MNNKKEEYTGPKTPMQLKTITKICKAKITDWANSVREKRPDIAEIIEQNTIITGGALVSLLSGEKVNDFDVYFRTADATEKVAQYYVDLFKEQNVKWVNEKVSKFEVQNLDDRIRILIKSQGIAAKDGENIVENSQTVSQYQYFEATRGDEAETFIQNLISHAAKKADNYSPIFLSDNAITLSNQLQIVIRFFGEPSEIHGNYDFVHCTNYYTSWENKVTLNMEAMECIRTKTLKYIGSLYPICSIIRLRKFINRGWKINAGQILKIAWQVNKLDMDDLNVMREQLTGCDAHYFIELMDILKDDKTAGKEIDQTYIANLVDTIFE